MLELEAALAQKPPQDIHRNKRAEVTDVAVIVHRWATAYMRTVLSAVRREFFYLAGKRVVKTQGQTEIVANERKRQRIRRAILENRREL